DDELNPLVFPSAPGVDVPLERPDADVSAAERRDPGKVDVDVSGGVDVDRPSPQRHDAEVVSERVQPGGVVRSDVDLPSGGSVGPVQPVNLDGGAVLGDDARLGHLEVPSQRKLEKAAGVLIVARIPGQRLRDPLTVRQVEYPSDPDQGVPVSVEVE